MNLRFFFQFFLVLLTVLGSLKLYSQDADSLSYEERYNLAKKVAYEVTKELCSNSGSASFMIYVGAGMTHTARIFEEDERPWEGAPEVEGLLASNGYKQALNECYGENQQAKQRFEVRLNLASALGNLAIIIGAAAVGEIGSIGLEATSGWLAQSIWATNHVRLAYLTKSGLETLRLSMGLLPLVPLTINTSKYWSLFLCSKIQSCWTSYSKVKAMKVIHKFEEEGIQPLEELQIQMAKNLAEKRDQLRNEMLTRQNSGHLSDSVRIRVENKIKIYEQQIRVLSEQK